MAETFPPHELSGEQKQILEGIREKVTAAAARIAELGAWPPHIKPETLPERIPKEGDASAPGFDAGVASALDMIPRDRQTLAARLHANYSKESVMQIRREAADLDPDSETAWWLAACYVCSGSGRWEEGQIDPHAFLEQLAMFHDLAADKERRRQIAEQEFKAMTSRYTLEHHDLPGIPFGTEDGCIQGAYIDGYPFGVFYSSKYGIYFIGTYEDSLGLENFPWSDKKDEKGRQVSGPVFGSKQFVKCADLEEMKRALAAVRAKLPLPERS